MSIDPIGEIGPRQAEGPVHVGEQLILQRKRETLHRVSRDDAARDGDRQIQKAVERGLYGLDDSGPGRQLTEDVHDDDADDQQDVIRERCAIELVSPIVTNPSVKTPADAEIGLMRD